MNWTAVNARLEHVAGADRAEVLACLEAIEAGALEGAAEQREREGDS